ncbi:MAG: sugar ABC transporter permease [Alphaproteobacteria bacterium]|nr:sugar ABC transporter permease [Alphaproteobacteria bacterium]
MKTLNHKHGWAMVIPATIILSIVGVLPLLTVINYSFFDIFILDKRFWIGLEWYQELMQSPRFWASLGRSLLFSTLILTIQLPLGILIALAIPKRGIWVAICLMTMSVPLLIPWNVIPIIWLNYLRIDTGFLGQFFDFIGVDFDWKFNPIHTWLALILMDVWHWTSLVILLAYSSLSTIPTAYYQAAAIDRASRWQIFRYIELPKMSGILLMAILLRFMDSLMIYTEAFGINSGGPQNATLFLGIDLGEQIKAFDYGPSAARSVIYFIIILFIVWAFKTALDRQKSGGLK